ncbi:MAG: NTP transferase domain-containing protein [Patescibacteria group bacterium]|nr:NTP transferase domain-containing protein [Patescibacteria group bacterium]
MPVVILCGGKGLRMRDYSDNVPKALVPIGGWPILLHVMKIYAHYGFKKFILCLGYKGDVIKEYFMNYEWKSGNFLLYNENSQRKVKYEKELENFEVNFVDTGLETESGARIKKIEKYIDTEDFLANYTDGLSDVNISDLYTFHKKMGKIATVTGVHQMSNFGIIEEENGIVQSFKQKPALPGWVNGGFFVFNRKIFDYLNENSNLEEETLIKLAEEKQLAIYKHEKFWTCMDTHKDVHRLNELWEKHTMPNTGFKGLPPWKVWND